MNIVPQAVVTRGEKRPQITAARLIRASGVAAMAGGLIFAIIQPIHPPDFLASVSTAAWATIMPFKAAMCLLFLLGITGIYARQVEESGWLGLAGFLLLTLSWWLQTAFVFAEALILPVLANAAPQFVASFLTLANGTTPEMNIGAIPAVYNGLVGLPYMLGSLVFGIAAFRAGVLPRGAGALLAVTAVATPLAALLPHEIQRLVGIPFGLAIGWMGLALLLERREQAAAPATSRRNPVETGLGNIGGRETNA